MGTPRIFSPNSQCNRKYRYFRKDDAEAAIRRVTARHEDKTSRPLQSYQCAHCSFWHIGHALCADIEIRLLIMNFAPCVTLIQSHPQGQSEFEVEWNGKSWHVLYDKRSRRVQLLSSMAIDSVQNA